MPPGDDVLISPEEIEALVASIELPLSGLFEPLEWPFEQVARWIVRNILYVLNRLWAFLLDAGSGFWTLLRTIVGNIVNAVVGVGGWIGDTVAEMFGWLWDQVRPLLAQARDYGAWIWGMVSTIAGDAISGVGDTLSGWMASISGFFQQGVNLLGTWLDDRLEWVTKDVGRQFDLTREQISDPITDFFSDLPERIAKALLDMTFTAFFEAMERSYSRLATPLLGKMLAIPELPDEVRPLIGEALAPTSEVGALMSRALTDGALSATTSTFFDAVLSPFTRTLNQIMWPSRLDYRSLILGEFRGIPMAFPATREAAEQGLSPDRFEIMRELNRPRLSERDLIWLEMRFPETRPDVNEELVAKGWAPFDVWAMRQLEQVIPSAQDLIRMAVREAFTEPVVRQFQLDEAFPEGVVAWAEKRGLSREWLLNYWRAHWDLPSTTQGFDMYHRASFTRFFSGQTPAGQVDGKPYYTVIDDQTLDLLLKSLDIMPYWRPRLSQIAYTPLTRVDIRRMHKMGVLSDEDVELAYLTEGYSPENARIQRDFVLDLNTEEPKALFRGTVIRRFREGFIDMDGLTQELQALGYGPGEVGRIRMGAELEYELDVLADVLASYRDLYRKDVYTDEVFADKLTALGVVPERVDAYLFRERARKGLA